MKKTLLTVLVAMLAITASAQADVISFQEVTDGYQHHGVRIRSDQPSANGGNDSDDIWIVGGLGNGDVLRTPVSFDIASAINAAAPGGATINSVTLTLVRDLDGSSGSGTYTAELRLLNTLFDETTATWNSPWTNPGGDFSTLLSTQSADVNAGEDTQFVFSSTPAFVAAAQAAVDNSTPLAFMIKGDDAMEQSSERNLFFFQPDDGGQAGGGAGTPPILTIDFVPEPATMSLLAIGGLGALIRRRRR